ncbi:unnamed protein product [Prunus armeniaca]
MVGAVGFRRSEPHELSGTWHVSHGGAVVNVGEITSVTPFKMAFLMLLGFFFQQLQMGWAVVKGKLLKLPPVSEFENQTSKALRKGSRALGSVLINFLAWHERLVAWKQNQHEFSTKEENMAS